MSGRKLSKEHIEKCAIANKGKKRTPEQRERISASLIGRKRSQETIDKLKARPILTGPMSSSFGLKRSDETKKRISEAKKQWYIDNPEEIEVFKERIKKSKGNKKLTENDVVKVFDLNKHGLNNNEIAKVFGVSKSAIRLIVTGKNWKELHSKYMVNSWPS
jgi:hypothetical protein